MHTLAGCTCLKLGFGGVLAYFAQDEAKLFVGDGAVAVLVELGKGFLERHVVNVHHRRFCPAHRQVAIVVAAVVYVDV